jgi:hypothetical protein
LLMCCMNCVWLFWWVVWFDIWFVAVLHMVPNMFMCVPLGLKPSLQQGRGWARTTYVGPGWSAVSMPKSSCCRLRPVVHVPRLILMGIVSAWCLKDCFGPVPLCMAWPWLSQEVKSIKCAYYTFWGCSCDLDSMGLNFTETAGSNCTWHRFACQTWLLGLTRIAVPSFLLWHWASSTTMSWLSYPHCIQLNLTELLPS